MALTSLAMISYHTSPLAQPGTGDGGGMNVYVNHLASALARQGVRVEVYTRAENPTIAPTIAVEPGLVVHHVPAGPVRKVPKEQLHAHLGEFTNAMERLLVRRKVDAIHANYWLSGEAGHDLKHRLDVPLLCTFHTLALVKAEAGTGEAEPLSRVEAEQSIIGCTDGLLASTAVEAMQLESLYGAPPERIHIVPPGVDTAFFNPGGHGMLGSGPSPAAKVQARRAAGLPLRAKLLVSVGRVQALKGFDVAVRALAAMEDFPDAHLVLTGGPSGAQGHGEEKRLRALVRAFDLVDRVHLLPPVPHELLATYYRAADVVVVPSRSESFGLVALEAAACGTPVVASAVGGLTTLVDSGRTGYLVEVNDAAGFAAAIQPLLGNSELAAAMGRAGAERALSYTWGAMAQRVRNLAQALTEEQLVECR